MNNYQTDPIKNTARIGLLQALLIIAIVGCSSIIMFLAMTICSLYELASLLVRYVYHYWD